MPKEVEDSGLLGRLRNFIDDLSDVNSRTYKVIKAVKGGIQTAQRMAKTYNDIAQWVGLPQVPRPFLGNQK